MCFGPQAEYIFPVIDFIDVFILVCLVISILNGHHRGFWLSTIQFLGMLVGVLLGSAIAPTVSQRIGITSSAYRPVAAILVLVITTTVVTSIAHWLADPLRLKAEWQAERQLPLGIKGELEKLAGAAFSALAVLVIFWFLGITFSRGPNQEIASQIKGSAIEQSLDALAPSPPPFLTSVQGILAGVPFPETWSSVSEPLIVPLAIDPTSAQTAAVLAVSQETYKVSGHGCGGIVTGSGYPIASNLIITNAHVVAGTSATTVQRPGGPSLPAEVILFDPARDLAVLRVNGLGAEKIPTAPGDHGTEGAIVGYPGGGDQATVAAVVDGIWTAQGKDIYSVNEVSRQIFIVEGQVVPGNSGGPLVDRNGHVIGIIFAASTSHPGEAYALTDQEISSGLASLNPQGLPIDTRTVACAL